MKRVAISGVNGFLGGELTKALARDPTVEMMLGLDIVAPRSDVFQWSSPHVFQLHDIARPHASYFLEHWIDVAIHLAFDASSGATGSGRVNVEGTERFLDACHRSGVSTLVHVSCALVYGRGQEGLATEDAPLLGKDDDLGVIRAKVQQEEKVLEFARSHPEVQTLVLRPALLVGPGSRHPLHAVMRRGIGVLPRRLPSFQLVHVQDVVAALQLLMNSRSSGVFNIAPDDALSPPEVWAALPGLALPFSRRALSRFFALPVHRRRLSPGMIPKASFDWYGGGRAISSERLKKLTGFRCRYDVRGALRALVGGSGVADVPRATIHTPYSTSS